MAENEQAKAQTASPSAEESIFTKIINGQIPCKKVYEDDQAFAFHDINATAPVHFLVVPKKPITQLSAVDPSDEQLLGHLMLVASKCAKQEGLDEGYRVVVNDGKHGCQSVYHLHLHVIGGKQLGWPPTGN
ncbi:adenosine 5'-monophosphoramidase HINT1-like [Watersipora subatra]|uniref:adenosine 5'-monophosphoramidase HINT1-like n=1 Tax=Watersipora subatra TaxID=2589382 RepID=UPI00355AF97A